MALMGKFAIVALGAAVAVSSMAHADGVQAISADWAGRVKLFGGVDFRAERDLYGQYTPAGSLPATGDYTYARIQARLGADAQISDTMKAEIRLSTGASQYTTFATVGTANDGIGGGNGYKGGFGERKDFMLDRAFLEYTGFASSGVDIMAGRTAIPFWQPGDLPVDWFSGASIEGLTIQWDGDMGSWKPFAKLSYTQPLTRVDGTPGNPNSVTDGPGISLLGIQLGVEWKTDSQWAKFDLANYEYNNIQGLSSAATGYSVTGGVGNALAGPTGMSANSSALGNSTDASGNFLYNYNMVQAGLEYGYNFGFAPVKIFGDYIQNTMTSNLNTGMSAGVTIGKVKDAGSWEFTADYRDIRKDATLGAYVDFQFLNGGTDLYGADYRAKYQMWANAGFDAMYEAGHKVVSNNGGFAYEVYILDWYGNF